MKLKKKKVVSLKGLKPKNHKKMSPKAYEGRKKEKMSKSEDGRRTSVKELSQDTQRLLKARDPRGV